MHELAVALVLVSVRVVLLFGTEEGTKSEFSLDTKKFCPLPARYFISSFLACFSHLSRKPRPTLLINEHIFN